MNPLNPTTLNESSCPTPRLPHLAMEESSLPATLAITATLAAAFGSVATAYLMRRYASPQHNAKDELSRSDSRSHRKESPSRSCSESSDDLEYCSAREVSSDSSERGLESHDEAPPSMPSATNETIPDPCSMSNLTTNDRSRGSYLPQSKLRWENDDTLHDVPPTQEENNMSTTITARQRRQLLDYSNRSSESEASSIPPDEWFEKLLSNHSAAAAATAAAATNHTAPNRPSDELETEEFHNKSASSEYIDRVGSLHHVQKSILKRASMLAGNTDEADWDDIDDDDHDDDDSNNNNNEPLLRRTSFDIPHDNDNVVYETATDVTPCCTCSQTSTPAPLYASQTKYRRPSFEPQRIPRRRSSTHNRRRFSKTGCGGGYPSRPDLERVSLSDSITTCADDEVLHEASFTFDPVHHQQQSQLQQQSQFFTQQSPFGRRPKAYTEEDSYISETERQFKGEEGFETAVTELARDFPSSLQLLRRTRAISALAHRLMAAPDEAACIEEVTRLMVLIFGLNRVSFAMVTGTDHFLLKRIEVKRCAREEKEMEEEDGDGGGGEEGAARNSFDSMSSSHAQSLVLEYLDSDFKRPFEGTAAGIVVKTLKEHYTPRTEFSDFPTHKVFYKQGLNSVLASPILVNGNQCMGVILLSKPEEDAFPKADRILISDIATLLGANIYSKRLRKASEEANKLSREMLHSFVPPKVLEKIEGFWDSNSEKYKALRSSIFAQESTCTPESSVGDKSSNEEEVTRTNSWYVANQDWSEAQIQEHAKRMKNWGVQDKLQMLKKLNRGESFNGEDSTGVIITTKGLDLDAELNITSRALYAENVHNVTIIFTDIVGFSRIAMGVTPIKVMNMLQNLFNRFDRLCDVHGVMKLETIGM
eukprot:CCRYP_006449-RA/>CCRYP_006449-RA protein AED:0.14 eAED:0.14 QI:470/1/1/1/0.5/0.33/3/1542/875